MKHCKTAVKKPQKNYWLTCNGRIHSLKQNKTNAPHPNSPEGRMEIAFTLGEVVPLRVLVEYCTPHSITTGNLGDKCSV